MTINSFTASTVFGNNRHFMAVYTSRYLPKIIVKQITFTFFELLEDTAQNRKYFAGCGLTQDCAGIISYHLLWYTGYFF